VLGLPPIILLRRKRLGDVHAKLLMGRPDVMVREIAIENGFAELDRFTASYRRQFSQLTVAHFAAAYRTVAISQEVSGLVDGLHRKYLPVSDRCRLVRLQVREDVQ
jgi:AraC-like DNA-binding protein